MPGTGEEVDAGSVETPRAEDRSRSRRDMRVTGDTMAESRLRLVDDAPRAAGSGIDPAEPVASILKRFPAAAPVLARRGLDACCGGKHPLEMACRAHGVPLVEVIAEIESAVSRGPHETTAHPEVSVYPRFLKAALIFTLTGGTALGAWGLHWRAARGGLGGGG